MPTCVGILAAGLRALCCLWFRLEPEGRAAWWLTFDPISVFCADRVLDLEMVLRPRKLLVPAEDQALLYELVLILALGVEVFLLAAGGQYIWRVRLQCKIQG